MDNGVDYRGKFVRYLGTFMHFAHDAWNGEDGLGRLDAFNPIFYLFLACKVYEEPTVEVPIGRDHDTGETIWLSVQPNKREWELAHLPRLEGKTPQLPVEPGKKT